MHYFAYLDEFGHIGPYISRNDKKYNTSPISVLEEWFFLSILSEIFQHFSIS